MLDELVQYIAAQQWPDLKLLPVFSMVDGRKSLHYEVVTAMRTRFPQMLPLGIPYSSEIERVARRRAPLNAWAPNSDAGAGCTRRCGRRCSSACRADARGGELRRMREPPARRG